MKTCVACGQARPLADFNVDKHRQDGRHCYCRICVRAKHREWSAANKAKVLKKQRDWYSENSEKKKSKNRAWYRANRERDLAKGREWVAANPEKARAKYRAFGARHPEVSAEKCRRRAAKKLGQLCDCCQTEDAKTNFVLAYGLARRLKMHVDHVRPISKDGKHCLHNLQLLTPIENLRKGARFLEAA